MLAKQQCREYRGQIKRLSRKIEQACNNIVHNLGKKIKRYKYWSHVLEKLCDKRNSLVREYFCQLKRLRSSK